jgi:hypothetical protein
MLMDTFAMNPTPQMIKPMIDIYANKDSFTGREIESAGMEKLSKAERQRPNTTGVAKIVGAAGDKTGLSPVQVDHLIRAYFGWLGSHAAMAADLAASPLTKGERPAPKLDNILLVGDFVKELPSNQSRYVTEFYTNAKKSGEILADVRHAAALGDKEKYRELMKEHKAELPLAGAYAMAQHQMAELNAAAQRVTASTVYTAEEKRQRLDRLYTTRNNIAKSLNEKAIAARQGR